MTTDTKAPTAFSRISAYPIVVEGSKFSGEILFKLPFSDKVIPYATGFATTLSTKLKPIESKFSSQISLGDSYANAALDKLEAAAPFIKNSSSADMYNAAGSAKDLPKDIYTKAKTIGYAQVSKVTDPVLEKAKQSQETIGKAQGQIKSYYDQVPKDRDGFIEFVKANVHSGINTATGKVDSLTQSLLAKRQSILSFVAATLGPVYDEGSADASYILTQLSRKDITFYEKGQSIFDFSKGKGKQALGAVSGYADSLRSKWSTMCKEGRKYSYFNGNIVFKFGETGKSEDNAPPAVAA